MCVFISTGSLLLNLTKLCISPSQNLFKVHYLTSQSSKLCELASRHRAESAGKGLGSLQQGMDCLSFRPVGHVRSYQFQQSRFAGHSHWHNIRHTKESKDMAKSKLSSEIARRIRLAVKEGGGSTNPKLNSLLARVLEAGKANDISNVMMLEQLKRLEKAKDGKGAPLLYVEGRGVGSALVIVEAYTDRQKFLRQQVQHVLKPYGGMIGDSGIASRSFNFKGVVYLSVKDSGLESLDHAMEVAIEAGAEEVIQGPDEENMQVFQFISEPRELHAVKKALEALKFRPHVARLEYIPHTFVHLGPDDLERASNMLDSLGAIEEVVRVFDNIAPAKPDS